MTLKNFVPTIWSARLLNHLDKNLVAEQLVNTDYEGEIKDVGDTVKINQFGAITVSDYNGTLTDPQELTSTQTTLTIDKAKAFNFIVPDIEAAQANVNVVDKASERAGIATADEVDKDIFAKMAEEAGLKEGTTSAPIALTKENVYDTIVDLGVKLNKENVSKVDRKLVLPPEAIGLLAKDARFTKKEDVLATGVVGKVGGFEIYESNNLKTAGNYIVAIAGVKDATSFAKQVVKTETIRSQKSFGNIVRGLTTYGVKVVQPKALLAFYIKKGA